MKKYAVTLAALTFAGLALGSGGLAAAEPDEKTIVEVTGDKYNGFGIHHYDGTAEFPPTNSEARAECSEYDTRLARVKCRTEIRVWYRDLGEMKRAINYQQALRSR
jgi:hypothetical protein